MTFNSRNTGAARFGLALITFALFGASMFLLTTEAIPDQNRDAFQMLLGALILLMGSIGQYYFTSKGRGPGN